MSRKNKLQEKNKIAVLEKERDELQGELSLLEERMLELQEDVQATDDDIKNRLEQREYDENGDTIRYAGDILDYMVLADLAKLKPNRKFYPNTTDIEAIESFIESGDAFFTGYDSLYQITNLQNEDVNIVQDEWFCYVNSDLDKLDFKTNILSFIEGFAESEETKDSEFVKNVLKTIQERMKSEAKIKTKEIGDFGEAVTIEHEKERLTQLERQDLIHLIKKIPEALATGFDIQSCEGIGGIKRYIEVKTTISKNKIHINSFNMTTNEWGAAETLKSNYYIYRLMVSSDGITLFVIKDPIQKYKDGAIKMTPRDGAYITFGEESGHVEDLLA